MKNLILAIMPLLLVGCSVVGHEEEQTCAGSTHGIKCASSREVYEITNHYNNAEDYAKDTGDSRVVVLDEEGKKVPYGTVASPEESSQQSKTSSSSTHTAKPYVKPDPYQHLMLPAPEPVAMRRPADIVRNLIRPYVDVNDRLKVPGHSYIEARSRTWVIDRNARSQANQFIDVGLRQSSQIQSYQVKDSGEIGVESRNGQAAPSPSEVKEQAKQNAFKLMREIQSGGDQ
ncbi:TraV family lipoprotein [Vibrio chaetopteri]|uniref:TraV family lipoprotein n=1 Tax=Vibrio chaetopteri TaxID=3016528 RepID=A0AAU8BRC0_9VIBR